MWTYKFIAKFLVYSLLVRKKKGELRVNKVKKLWTISLANHNIYGGSEMDHL